MKKVKENVVAKETKSKKNSTKKVEEIVVTEEPKGKKASAKKVEEIVVAEESKGKKIAKLVFNIIFWVGITVLAVIWLTDFIKIKNEKEPIFCLSEKTHKFDDGTVDECVGLGYKVYSYHRESLNNAYQFSPFFVGMKK